MATVGSHQFASRLDCPLARLGDGVLSARSALAADTDPGRAVEHHRPADVPSDPDLTVGDGGTTAAAVGGIEVDEHAAGLLGDGRVAAPPRFGPMSHRENRTE